MTHALIARYRGLAASPDPRQRALGRAQLARLEHVSSRPTGEAAPSRWAHVSLVALFEEAGNRIYQRRNGRCDTGHEPLHGSTSGQCLTIDPERGIWWCRSCRRGGDALGLVMALHGWSRARATIWLKERYGVRAREGRRA